MKHLNKYPSLALALALCLSLAACGGDKEVVVGDDWRVTGIVCGSGTITREDGDVDVLVTVDDNSAAFYLDDEEQTLFDSVDFPFTIPNARERFAEISFADLTANGESDVEISFTTDSGTMYLTWLWYIDGYYLFRGDLSTYTLDGADLSEYTGLWQWEGESLWLCIYDDATWSFFNDQEDVIASGTLTADEFGVTLCFDGSGDEMRLDVAVSGDLLDGENNGTLVPADKIESCAIFHPQWV